MGYFGSRVRSGSVPVPKSERCDTHGVMNSDRKGSEIKYGEMHNGGCYEDPAVRVQTRQDEKVYS